MALHTADGPNNATALVAIVTSATATLATMYKAVSDMKHPDNKPEEGNWKGFTISYNMDSWTKDTTAKLSCLYTNWWYSRKLIVLMMKEWTNIFYKNGI